MFCRNLFSSPLKLRVGPSSWQLYGNVIPPVIWEKPSEETSLQRNWLSNVLTIIQSLLMLVFIDLHDSCSFQKFSHRCSRKCQRRSMHFCVFRSCSFKKFFQRLCTKCLTIYLCTSVFFNTLLKRGWHPQRIALCDAKSCRWWRWKT